MSKKTKFIISLVCAALFFVLGLWCGIKIDRVSVWVGQKLLPALIVVGIMAIFALILRAKIKDGKEEKAAAKAAKQLEEKED